MRRGLAAITLTTGFALGLAACEGGGDPVEQALREAAAARQAAATPTTAEIEAGRPATGDQAYVRAAIQEHRSAIARAEASLRETSDPALRQLARSTIDARKAEIAALEAWRPGETAGE
ncbi:DUF305 domain-containing protein [Brevundimonas sp.]|uniref:DUF305 domain-containing protein n=1 Tax=Brevundimonas sp. TaxID=1871086 RepID=UPI002D4B7AD4|nr:DUF305 domain-containing protein [Brevundimonas sp.]HYD26879.1 DUF305 domain-containing protein [Brevundimonas sp.]